MALFSSNKNFVGIDIGTSGIKVIELMKDGNSVILSNYGFSEKKAEDIVASQKADPDYLAKAITAVLKKSKIQTKNVVTALPTFSVFSSVLSLKNVPDKSLDSAIRWEAKKIIPLPLDEMVLDWKKIEDPEDSNSRKEVIKVLITGAPRILVNSYIDIYKKAKLNLLSLETETFSLVRSLIGNDKSPFMIVEIGASTTDISLVKNSIPVLSRSIDIGGKVLTDAIAKKLKVGTARADQFKVDLGLSSIDLTEEAVPGIIKESVAPIVNEIKYALSLFQNSNDSDVEKIILSGGSSMIANMDNFFSSQLDKKVIVGNPWSRVIFPHELTETLDEIGPKMAVAIGLAMREVN